MAPLTGWPTAAPSGTAASVQPPLVLHVVFRFDVGGLENGVVNLINHMPAAAYRHAVVALTEVTDFRHRLRREDVPTLALNKAPGHGLWLYPRLFRLFRQLRPAIVHTRNLAALECAVPAWAAGVPARVHSEHGLEGRDLDAGVTRYDRMRRWYRPFVSHHIALSRDLEGYLSQRVGVAPRRLSQFYNGVDAQRFSPGPAAELPGCPFDPARHWLVGTVGRMQPVKDQLTLARAFALALQRAPAQRERMRLVLVGDGPQRDAVTAALRDGGVLDLCWLAGERNDVPALMRALDLFVLPSLSEGVSNVILEAMACGLPVLATNVGGNPELVMSDRTGVIVPAADPSAMADAMLRLATDPQRSAAMGQAARVDVLDRFSMQAMVRSYQGLYDRLLSRDTCAD